MSSPKEDVKYQKVKHLEYEEVHTKNKLTQSGLHILMSIFTSNMREYFTLEYL